MKQSFVIDNHLNSRIIKRTTLIKKIKRCKKDGSFLLENLDLSKMKDCNNIDFNGLTLRNVIFSRFNPQVPQKRTLFNLSFIGAQLFQVSFAQAHLYQCTFDTLQINLNQVIPEDAVLLSKTHESNIEKITHLKEVDFFYSELVNCRFIKANLKTVDFRYSNIIDCAMGRISVSLGDFYSCSFKGTTCFYESLFKYCSFTCATFENDCIRMNNITKGVAQEHSNIYHYKLIHANNWIKYNPNGTISSMNPYAYEEDISKKSKAYIAKEASEFYKVMSGIYAGKGLYRDSNWAHKKAKDWELKHYQLSLKLPKMDRGNGLGQLFYQLLKIKLISFGGYGFKIFAPIKLFIAVILLFTVIYYFETSNSTFIQSLFLSFKNMVSPSCEFLTYENKDIILNLCSYTQSVLAIIIMGYFGFILANKMRNDS